jgi:RNA:NAD 2'-phosphotransferase (TPT1/KptA family)
MLQKTTIDQLRETVTASMSYRGTTRFEIRAANGIEYIRASYGHTFDVSQGSSLDGSGSTVEGEESDPGTLTSRIILH